MQWNEIGNTLLDAAVVTAPLESDEKTQTNRDAFKGEWTFSFREEPCH